LNPHEIESPKGNYKEKNKGNKNPKNKDRS